MSGKGVLSIVGRPNVGKSTLFNRIVGGRRSITLKEPGITRDRLYGRARYRGREFLVVDTGGMVPNPKDPLSRAVQFQVELAIQEADSILFLVDGSTGPHPLDEEILNTLRSKGRHFYLVVNKIDRKETKTNMSEFHRFGVHRFYPVSAEYGTGVAELLDDLVESLPQAGPEVPPGIGVVILGRPNVGKSTFLNSLLGEPRAVVDCSPGTTRDLVEEEFTLHNRRYRLVDTAGIRRRSRVKEGVEYISMMRALRGLKSADVALLILDGPEGPTFQDKHLAQLVEEAGRGLILVANKVDLLNPQERMGLEARIRQEFRFVSYAPLLFVSALHNLNVFEALTTASWVYDEAGKRVRKALLNQTILPELRRSPPPQGQVLGLRQVGLRPPEFLLTTTPASRVDESYVRFVVRTIRSYFGFKGSPIRIRLRS